MGWTILNADDENAGDDDAVDDSRKNICRHYLESNVPCWVHVCYSIAMNDATTIFREFPVVKFRQPSLVFSH